MSTDIKCSLLSFVLIMEWEIVELTEALMFIGVFQWYIVREAEEEELKGLSGDKVEARSLDLALTRFGLVGAMKGNAVFLHLLKLVYDGRVEFVFVGEVILEVVTG
jgi:hypothetical protein